MRSCQFLGSKALPAEAVETLPEQHTLAWLEVRIADPTVYCLRVAHHLLAIQLHQPGKVLPALRLPGLGSDGGVVGLGTRGRSGWVRVQREEWLG